MTPPPAEALVGTTLSERYLIERVIGEGGMGAVYQASHTHMRKRVAVKVLHPEMCRMPEVVARFEREAMAAAHIDHPNIVTATDFGKTAEGSFFLVLEFVEGTSLRDLIGKSAPLPPERMLRILRQIAAALQRAHTLGIVHRDLKPENVMLVEREGDPDFVKVLDFGIAKVPVGELAGLSSPGQVLTQLGMVYGTPEYMPPEQAAGQEVDARADLYSLGVMAYEMLCGLRPFDHENKVALLGMHVTAEVPPIRERVPGIDVPPEVEALVMKLLEKQASARFDGAKELIDAIDSMIGAPMVIASGSAPGARPFARSLPGAGYRVSTPGGQGYNAFAAGSGGAMVPRGSSGDYAGALRTPGRSSSRPPSKPLPTPAHTGAPLPVIVTRPRGQPRLSLIAGIALGVGALFTAGIILLSKDRHGVGAADGGTAGMALEDGGPSPNVVETPGTSTGTSAGTAPGTATAGTTPGDEGSVDRAIAAASAALSRGDDAAVIQQLTPLVARYPDRVDLHRLLTRAYSATGSSKDAMREADAWLRLDPTAAKETRLIEDVKAAALSRDSREATEQAFTLLEGRMGTSGIDVLYEVAYGSAASRSPAAAAKARTSLGRAEVRGRASPALQVTLDLMRAGDCEGKRALLPRAKEVGDARTLGALKPLQQTKGCGFAAGKDCWPCLRKDGALGQAVTAVEARAKR